MSKNLKIFALWGLHEIGKNCYVFEKNEDLIIVDCGVKFLNNSNLADGAIPNFSHLLENKTKIKAVFITHGHEDHIGGIPHLLQLIPTIPFYGSEFTASLLKKKLQAKFHKQVKKFPDEPITTGEFRVSFFQVTHSIPGSFGLVIEVLKDNTRIMVTGDFKFDWTGIGEQTDLFKLTEWGKKGINLLLSDSTNAEVEGSTPSESKVVKRLENIISEAPGRVIITSFASNVYRLKKVIEIAKKTGKKIVLLGTSLERIMEVIKKASLWKIDKSVFLVAKSISKTANNKLIIFCTGSQGEEKAVLSRLAHQIYPGWKVEPKDSIILTSSPIMDNKFAVEAINNRLFAIGAKIYENSREDLLHASGHACQEDLKLILRLVKPAYFMPFHGNFRMLKKHAQLAKEVGIRASNIFVCQNGEVVESQRAEFWLSKLKINAQPNYVLNKKLLPLQEINNNLNLREKMLGGGLILVVLFDKEKKEKLNNLSYIFTYGFINMKKNEDLLNEWKRKLNEHLQKRVINSINKGLTKDFSGQIKEYFEKELLKDWTKEKALVHTIRV